jgi:FkbM family methyltransferase
MQIVDAGANIGLYSLLLARLAGDNGRVYSFEPEPNLFGIFSENCAANKALNILPFQCAAGRLNERALFRRSSFNSGNNSLGGNGAGLVEVEVVRVDDVLPVAAVDFIKLDVQGHELAALAGMERVLASSPAVRVLFEFWPAGLRAAHTPPETLLNFFFERGFDIYELDEPGPRKLSEPALLIEKLGHKRYVNLFASRTGIPKS